MLPVGHVSEVPLPLPDHQTAPQALLPVWGHPTYPTHPKRDMPVLLLHFSQKSRQEGRFAAPNLAHHSHQGRLRDGKVDAGRKGMANSASTPGRPGQPPALTSEVADTSRAPERPRPISGGPAGEPKAKAGGERGCNPEPYLLSTGGSVRDQLKEAFFMLTLLLPASGLQKERSP